MGYLHIDNLYKNTEILNFKECYAMEKIHGTSAHIAWKDGQVRLFAGGVKHDDFAALFDIEYLTKKFEEHFGDYNDVTLFGEAYGGKCQAMQKTYGNELKFVGFDVKVGDNWLTVPAAAKIFRKFGLEFVRYKKIPATLDELNKQRDIESTQAVRNGCGRGKMREGIVARPLIELTKNNGKRIIVKHKRPEFSETRTPRKVNPDKLKVIAKAKEIADEWVTAMRLNHVLDKIPQPHDITKTGQVIKAMIEDVRREAAGEIVESKDEMKEIGRKTALMYKSQVTEVKL